MDDQVLSVLSELEKSGIKLNKNHRRDLHELISEISGRDGIDAASVLNDDKEIRELLQNSALNGPKKLERVKDILVGRRYPTYTRARAAFSRKINNLKLDSRIKITPTPFFEDNKITVEFSYESPDGLREVLKSLEKLDKIDLVKEALEDRQDSY
ncbi:MAG: hypothetical protein KAX16_07125 [Actinomycetia bacterium]|nr:hypothetical protein [Actinomycetes bacterium]